MAQLLYTFEDANTRLYESDGALFAAVNVNEEEGEWEERPVDAQINWGEDKRKTLWQLKEKGDLEYDFEGKTFVIREKNFQPVSTPSMSLVDLYKMSGQKNCELRLVGNTLVGFTNTSREDSAYQMDLRHQEVKTQIDQEIMEGRMTRQQKFDEQLAVIASKYETEVEVHRCGNEEALAKLRQKVEEKIQEGKCETATLVAKLGKESLDDQTKTREIMAENKRKLDEITLQHEKEYDELVIANSGEESERQLAAKKERELENLELARYQESLKRKYEEERAAKESEASAISAAANRQFIQETAADQANHAKTIAPLTFSKEAIARAKEREDRELEAYHQELEQRTAITISQVNTGASTEMNKMRRDAEITRMQHQTEHEETMEAANYKSMLERLRSEDAHKRTMDSKKKCQHSIF